MNIYFDKRKKQLICNGELASSDYWDKVWEEEGISREDIISVKRTVVSKITKKYLHPSDGVILEGGCGLGKTVASLSNNDYKAIGVDFADKLVEKLNQHIPELDIRQGDVRNLKFENDYFIGYWSLGVIEHFWQGYDPIASEMYRVLKNNGYLFLSFPYMSPLRRLKCFLNMYALYSEKISHENFQFFVLNPKEVIEDFTKKGFKLVKRIPLNPIKGMTDEVKFLGPMLRKLHKIKEKNIIAKIILKVYALCLAPIASHSLLLVLKKCSLVDH